VCGISGIFRYDPTAAPPESAEALRTRDAMTSRGPDGAGLWSDPSGHVVLGSRRLAIIDLSEAGLQPMASVDGRYRIVFNGEIYNYAELRAQLAHDYSFRSQSDTEVLLALFIREGLKGLGRLRGMFAFAIWDDRECRLLLGRDPNGIKPLYYNTDGRYLRFASQVKALLAGGAVGAGMDPGGLCGFLLWGFVPEPSTIYSSVKALPAGHFLWAGTEGVGRPQPLPYSSDTGADAGDILAAIEDSVTAHLVSDVPIAVFLSSGLDSALLAALATRHLATPPTTITLRFREFVNTTDDEGPLAAHVAREIGTRHIERWVSREEFLGGWHDVILAMDQPSIDGVNTYWISKAAREAGVKVALSGLGGDELLGGYPSFRQVPSWNRWARRAARVPGLARAWPRISRWFERGRPKLKGLLRYGSTLEGAYFLRRGLFLPDELPAVLGEDVAAAGLEASDPEKTGRRALAGARNGWKAVHALETGVYLRNQLLRDSDWASMANSVELRVPFVDARLQLAAAAGDFGLPRRTGKRGVVRCLAPSLPAAIFKRRKTGFRVPVAAWLEEPSMGGHNTDSRVMALRILEAFGVAPRMPLRA